MLRFEIFKNDNLSRLGRLYTAHGYIDTPAFMPVGTCATVKAMMPESVAATGAQIILGNTYHLMLQPGAELVYAQGGLHKFMNWPGPILTDSGGFQVMSLSGLSKITEEGVTFNSHIDGSKHMLSPERSIEIQHLLDSNITMAFDECTKLPAPYDKLKSATERSMRWARRSYDAFKQREGYGIFGIVQGGTDQALREYSMQELLEIPFDGYAIGGLAVGEPQSEMFRTLEFTAPFLAETKPRYLMGVGTLSDIVGAVARGVDMFDCVMPTRSGRTAQAFTRYETLNMRNAVHKTDLAPIDSTCDCPACRNYSRAYIHHLFRAKEILAPMLLTWHNIRTYQRLMADIRTAISEGKFKDFVDEFFAKYKGKTRI